MRPLDVTAALVDVVGRFGADELSIFKIALKQDKVRVVATERALEGGIVADLLLDHVHLAAVVPVEGAPAIDTLPGGADALAAEAGVLFGLF